MVCQHFENCCCLLGNDFCLLLDIHHDEQFSSSNGVGRIPCFNSSACLVLLQLYSYDILFAKMQLSVPVVQLVAGAVVMQYRVLNVTTLSQTSGEWLHQ